MVKVTPAKASEIADFLGVPLHGGDMVIDAVCPASAPSSGALVYLQRQSQELLEQLNKTGSAFVIAGDTCESELTCPHVLVRNPRLGFARVIARFFEDQPDREVAPSSRIAPRARLGVGVSVGEFCVIDDDVEIGDETSLADHVVVRRNTSIGERCRIGSHVVIGEDGFGYGFDCGTPVRIPHLGGVRIGNDVGIHCRTSIDRGTLSDTVIADHVKIGPQVRIAHNCRVGEGSLIVGGSSLCGSVEVGRHCWIGAGSLLRNGGIVIGDDAMVGMGAVVVKSVNAREVVVGNPARLLRVRAPDEEF